MAPELWREDFTNPMYGRAYTIFYLQLRGNDADNDSMVLHVNNNGQTRLIFIHDPAFFVLNFNPLGLPFKQLILPPRSGLVSYSLALRAHSELNTPNKFLC